jgi:hypothetical protein
LQFPLGRGQPSGKFLLVVGLVSLPLKDFFLHQFNHLSVEVWQSRD